MLGKMSQVGTHNIEREELKGFVYYTFLVVCTWTQYSLYIVVELMLVIRMHQILSYILALLFTLITLSQSCHQI